MMSPWTIQYAQKSKTAKPEVLGLFPGWGVVKCYWFYRKEFLSLNVTGEMCVYVLLSAPLPNSSGISGTNERT